MNVRYPELVVLSDLHLGTYGCHADELIAYLESIEPQTLILNGDIVDFWYLHWRYWPKSHMRVLELIFAKASRGTRVYYLTGNHDDVMRRFSDLTLGNFFLVDKLILNLQGKEYWFFHGDVFDRLPVEGRFLSNFFTRFGGWGYDRLILLNRFINKFLLWIGRPRVSLSKIVRAKSSDAIEHLKRFEELLADHAAEKNYYGVVCGHVHSPCVKKIISNKYLKEVLYLNSGDWVEHLTSLEFSDGVWILKDFSDVPPRINKISKPNPDIGVLT